jgi:hypothetical protein
MASIFFSENVLYLRLANNSMQKRRIGSVIVASIVTCVLLVFMLLLIIWSKRFNWCGAPSLHKSEGSGGGIIAFRYTDLVHATNFFLKKLGGGGFDSVFFFQRADPTRTHPNSISPTTLGGKIFHRYLHHNPHCAR